MSKATKAFAIAMTAAGSAFASAIMSAVITATPALAQYAGEPAAYDNAPDYNGQNYIEWRCNCTGRSQQERAF